MKSLNNTIVVQSILVAFFADIRCINWGLTRGGFVGEGVMSLLYMGIVGLIIVSTIFSKRKIGSSFKAYSIFFPIYLLLFYVLTNLFISSPVVSFPFFLIFTISAFLIPHITLIDSYTMLKTMMILPSFAIVRYHSVFASVVDWTTRLPMDVSYGYLIPILANVVFMWYYFREEKIGAKIITLLFSLINLVFFLNILLYGSRGPILCVFLLLCALWCVKLKDNDNFQINKNKLFVLLLLVVSVVLLSTPLLIYIDGALNKYGIEVDAITKMVYLQDMEGDISNGRSELNAITWKGIMEHPLFGNGLDQYDNNNPGEDYPHNFILQILYDGGLFLLLLFMPIFIRIPKYLKFIRIHELLIFFVLFFGSVPGALFSQDLWCIPVLWMFFGLMCSKQFVFVRNN